jgi:hypothetical protein
MAGTVGTRVEFGRVISPLWVSRGATGHGDINNLFAMFDGNLPQPTTKVVATRLPTTLLAIWT